MEHTEESLDNLLRHYEDQTQVNDINFVTAVSDPCESDAVHLNEEECDVHT